MSKLSVASFLETAKLLSPWVTILMRGGTGIGKSYMAHYLGKHFNLPVIDRRLSQLTEGDVIGLPSTDGNVTRFNPPDWFKRACDEPVILFLDEINRATVEVMQAAFQIVLDRELNGYKLHPLTRVYSAINFGAQFTVNEMDPAFLRRFAVVDLEPTVEDWIKYMRDTGGPSVIIDFIANNDTFLDPVKDAEPGTVQPTRASWDRLGTQLREAGMFNDEEPLHGNPCFASIVKMFVGMEPSIKFVDFCKTFESQITGEDVLERYNDVREKIKGLGQERWNICIEKLVSHTHKNLKRFSDSQGKNVRKFMQDLPNELRIDLWSKLTQLGIDEVELAKTLHPHVVDLVCGVFGVVPGEAGVGMTPKIPTVMLNKK